MGDSETDTKAEPVLITERRGAVVVLRLNRPEARNSLNPELLTAVGLGMLEAEKDPDIRAVVLTGTGDKAFSAGMDLRAFAEGGSVGGSKEGMQGFARFTQGEIGVPIVGAANATAVAGGFELLLGCDVVVASESAKFGLPEVKRGLFAAGGGVFISTRIPLAVALELTLTGDPIDGRGRSPWGSSTRSCRRHRCSMPPWRWPSASRATAPWDCKPRRNWCGPRRRTWKRHEHRAAELQPTVFGSEDAKEGATAFIEKRDPVWQGR